ncbi:hypothetical protein Bca4012_029010 [Brassica carinata]|uniref:Uncharacterized protein n=1 Tax=Brassica carinata TaxID=52824 RepID=A0A8X7RMU5_BRACI|nr:hypothetical protein Bca52824_049542 [Brassica carinata]
MTDGYETAAIRRLRGIGTALTWWLFSLSLFSGEEDPLKRLRDIECCGRDGEPDPYFCGIDCVGEAHRSKMYAGERCVSEMQEERSKP